MAHVEGGVLVGPALVGIDTDGHVGVAAQSLDGLLVVAHAHLHLYNLEGGCLVDFCLHLGGVGVVADGVGGVGSLVGVEAPDFVPGLAHDFAGEVVQGDVDRCLGGAVVGGDGVHVLMDVFDAEGVGKLRQVEAAQVRAYALDVLAQVWRHRSLAVSAQAVVVDAHLHAGGGGALAAGEVERVLEAQLVWLESQVQAAVATLCTGGLAGGGE